MNEIVEKIIDAVSNIANSVTACVNTHAELAKIKRTLGISKRQEKNIAREVDVYSKANEQFIKWCEENPGLQYEIAVGNFHISNINKVITEAQRMVNKDDMCFVCETLDNDWLKRFFDVAGETSEEEKQKLLAKVLLGELHKPDSISYRTLGLLKNLSKNEIIELKELFKTIMTFDGYYISLAVKNFEFDFLDQTGFIISKEVTIKFNDTKELIFDNDLFELHILEKPDETFFKDAVLLPFNYLTKSGIELFKIIDKDYNEQYFKDLAKELQSKWEYAVFNVIKKE